MAVLPDSDRLKIWRAFMRYMSKPGSDGQAWTKAELKTAVDAVDQWVDDNSISFNNALPNPFKTSATAGQKSLLLVAVVLMRYNLEFLKALFGEVD